MHYQTHYMYIRSEIPVITTSVRQNKLAKIFSLFLIGSGVLLLFYVVFPILTWQILYAPNLVSGNMLSPIPKELVLKQNNIGAVLASANTQIPSGANLTYASNWFPTGNPKTNTQKEYTLSIQKLGIKNARVIVGSDDLAKSLIHYGGSGLPGEYGNAVVFGHSILPQFYDPSNYKAIFSTLHTLKAGDTIEINFDDVKYQYRIFAFSVIDPTDISVLEQNYDNSYLTLITCTPPGTYWKRLVVKAKVDKI